MGFVVVRLRRLAFEVRRAAAAGYGEAVTAEGDDEISELARAFSEAGAEIKARIAELERREQALREFIANTTHDVMVPLTVLQGHLAEGETQIVAAREEAHYVAALVHNLGLAARLDSEKPRVEKTRVELGELLQRVASRHRPVANERDIAIEVGEGLEPLYAMADVTLLEQAVSNLAYNAVRHNREGGHVALIVENRKGASGEARFRIRVLDDGPGIPATDIVRLMERGAHGDLSRGREQGQGIGLDIAKRAVEVQGFTLALAPGAEGGLEADIEGIAVA
jgi:signal transduction histidine kinase